MDFLNILNVVIGMSFVMLLLSMAVTGITQILMSIVNSKGGNLRDGIADLLGVFGIKEEDVKKRLADALLRHPLLADSPLIPGAGQRLGTVIQREELAQLLIELASDNTQAKIDAGVKAKLVEALRANGIENPDELLQQVRIAAMEIEAQTGALTITQRTAKALYEKVDRQYLSKIHASFDRTIERVIERFTGSARVYTFAVSLLLALIMQVDSVAIVNRLYTDRELQTKVVAAAVEFADRESKSRAPVEEAVEKEPGAEGAEGNQPEAVTATPESEPAAVKSAEDEQLIAQARESLQQMMSLNLLQNREPFSWQKLFGILVTVILLSFGAPFWYNVLKDAIRLRGVLAPMDDQERAERQTEAHGGSAGAASGKS